MPRHMEQPGSRHSKPAVLKMVEAFGFGLALDRLRAGDDHGADLGGDVVALDDGGGGAEVFDAAVGAGAEEDGVDLDLCDGRAGFEAHVLEARSKDLRSASVAGVGERGNGALMAVTMPGEVPQVTVGSEGRRRR